MLLALLFLCGACAARADVRLPAIFGENMVLQRDSKVPVWGWADPGESIQVTFEKQTVTTVAGPDGRWKAVLPPLPAGGPFELIVRGKTTVIFHNVLVGEVWFCSGQSNMDWPLIKADGGADEVAQANFPQIRIFKTVNVSALAPKDDVIGGWSVCTPESAAPFSAVAYFFGKELHQKLQVPVGLIDSDWQGTRLAAWMSYDGLIQDPDYKAEIEKARETLKNQEQMLADSRRAQAEWEKNFPNQDPGDKGLAQGWADPQTSSADWPGIQAPGLWQQRCKEIDFQGIIYFRKEIEVPAAWAGQDLLLHLGSCDDFDTTYFNNVKVGGLGAETENYYVARRHYKIPGKLVKAGRNVIAVRIMDHFGGGGFTGTPGEMSIAPAALPKAEPIQLAGTWRYKVEHIFAPARPTPAPYDPLQPNWNAPGVLFNRKINGLIPYAIRGALWYQNEGSSNGYQYKRLLPELIQDWRRHWSQGDFPCFIVQMPNLGNRPAQPAESPYAEVREAQLLAGKMPGNGVAVTIDIGTPGDNHPRNKRDVGKRLAAQALHKTYGLKDVVPCGPLYQSMAVEEGRVRLQFDCIGGGLVAKAGKLGSFAIAGEDRKFVWAEAVIDGDAIVVSSQDVPKPVAVRYAWADDPECSLYNKAGLPASPFRTDDWPGVTEKLKN